MLCRFAKICEVAYLALRKRANFLITLFMMMMNTGIPEISTIKDIKYLQVSSHCCKQLPKSQEFLSLVCHRSEFWPSLFFSPAGYFGSTIDGRRSAEAIQTEIQRSFAAELENKLELVIAQHCQGQQIILHQTHNSQHYRHHQVRERLVFIKYLYPILLICLVTRNNPGHAFTCSHYVYLQELFYASLGRDGEFSWDVFSFDHFVNKFR